MVVPLSVRQFHVSLFDEAIRGHATGRKVAIDASMCLYQFLIAVRSEGSQLVSSDGETTRCALVCVFVYICVCTVCLSYLQSPDGVLLPNHQNDGERDKASVSLSVSSSPAGRMSHQLKPASSARYVFDGKPPDMKSGEVGAITDQLVPRGDLDLRLMSPKV